MLLGEKLEAMDPKRDTSLYILLYLKSLLFLWIYFYFKKKIKMNRRLRGDCYNLQRAHIRKVWHLTGIWTSVLQHSRPVLRAKNQHHQKIYQKSKFWVPSQIYWRGISGSGARDLVTAALQVILTPTQKTGARALIHNHFADRLFVEKGSGAQLRLNYNILDGTRECVLFNSLNLTHSQSLRITS